eukprot:scaffold27981_cov37-Cyclotella_meneghiniana.AAC.7
MRLVKNIRVGQNKSVHYVGCFGPKYAVPNKSDVVNNVDLDVNERRSVRGGQRLVIPDGIQEAFDCYTRAKFGTITAAVDNAPKIKRTQQRKPLVDNAKKKRPNTADAPHPAPTREEEIQQLRTSLGDNILKRRNVDATIESVLRRLKELEGANALYYAEWKGWLTSGLEEEVTELASTQTSSSLNNNASSIDVATVSGDDEPAVDSTQQSQQQSQQPFAERGSTKPGSATDQQKKIQYVWN